MRCRAVAPLCVAGTDYGMMSRAPAKKTTKAKEIAEEGTDVRDYATRSEHNRSTSSQAPPPPKRARTTKTAAKEPKEPAAKAPRTKATTSR